MDNFPDDEIIKELHKRLKDKDNAYQALMVLTRKLESLNDRLVESEKLKSHFLSNIRNEINNPLTAVLTMSELLKAGDWPPDGDTFRTVVDTIYKETFDLNFQLRNIFAAAELEAGESTPNASSVDITALLRNTISSFQHRLGEKGMTVTLELDKGIEDGRLFLTDPEKLERILSNLLSNAIEFSPQGSAVEVMAGRESGGLTVSVTDHGMGIDEKDHGAVFERFRQLDTGATKSHRGNGLGLSIARAALEMLGGRMTLVSKKGEGASFTFTLPELAPVADTGVFSVDAGNFFFAEGGSGERF